MNDYNYDQKEAKVLRDIGFGVINTHRNDGVHRGTGFTLALIDEQNESYRIISKKTSEHLKSNCSFNILHAFGLALNLIEGAI